MPLLAAAALLAGPLVASAQATPARTGGAALTSASPGVNPGHVEVLAAALKKMRKDYASFANFTPGPQDIFDYNIGRGPESPTW